MKTLQKVGEEVAEVVGVPTTTSMRDKSAQPPTVKMTFRIQLITVPIYAPTTGINAKPIPRINETTITMIMKIITSPEFLTIKLNDLFVLSMASVPSIRAVVMMNRATGINTNVIKHTSETMAARIKVPNLLVTRLTLFFMFMGCSLIMSLAISTIMQLAINPMMDAIK